MRATNLLAFALCGCRAAAAAGFSEAPHRADAGPSILSGEDASLDAVPGPGARLGAASTDAGVPWTLRFDLDGDGRNDEILPDFTGGAHCCYRIAVALTRTGRTVDLPFQMDGGYVVAFDLSQPETFDVRWFKGHALPELVMRIETYNGELLPLPKDWSRRYGIHSHRIAVGFADGRVHARDLPPPHATQGASSP